MIFDHSTSDPVATRKNAPRKERKTIGYSRTSSKPLDRGGYTGNLQWAMNYVGVLIFVLSELVDA